MPRLRKQEGLYLASITSLFVSYVLALFVIVVALNLTGWDFVGALGVAILVPCMLGVLMLKWTFGGLDH